MICEQKADWLKWCGGTDIEDKPGRYVPEMLTLLDWDHIYVRKKQSDFSYRSRIVGLCKASCVN